MRSGLREAVGVAAMALSLGLWGLGWCLPGRARLEEVLPAGLDSPSSRALLESSWRALYAKLGENMLLHPDVFSYGFEDGDSAAPGWTAPPPLLRNSIRSFYLRSGHEDESDILVALSRLRPLRLDLNPRIYFYGGAYMYALGGWMAASAVLSGTPLARDIQVYLAHPEYTARLYFAGRLFSVLAFVAACLLVLVLGRRYWDAAAGAWGAVFFALSPGIVIQAHYMKPHLLGQAFVMGIFYFCAELAERARSPAGAADARGERRLWMGAGSMLGLAAGSAAYMWSSGIFIVLCAALRARLGAPWRAEVKKAAFACACAVAVFLLVNPFLVYDAGPSWRSLLAVSRFSARDPAFIWTFLSRGLPKGMTLPLALWVAAGCAAAVNRERPSRLLALLGFLCHLSFAWTFQSASFLDSIRQFPAAFLGCLLAGGAASRWTRGERPGRMRACALGAALLAAAYAWLASAALDYNFSLDSAGLSTRRLAGEWIEANVPRGAEIGLTRLPQPSNVPYFHWSLYRLRFFKTRTLAGLDPAALPERLVLASPSYSDHPALDPLLDARYVLEKSFPPRSLGWISPPLGESYANPLVEIYRKRSP